MKLLIWQTEMNGECRCREVFPHEEVYKHGLMIFWQNESSNNFVIKNLQDAKEFLEDPEQKYRLGGINIDTVDFQTQNIYISSSARFVTDKYLTFYHNDNKTVALVDVDDSVNIDELSQQDLLDLVRSA